MHIEKFFESVISQNKDELKKYFHQNASIKWHCTNEKFNVDEYIQANCEYPGEWCGEIERIEEIGDIVIMASRVFLKDKSLSSHVVSFIKIKDNLIVDMDEYWGDDGEIPKWRQNLSIGKSIK